MDGKLVRRAEIEKLDDKRAWQLIAGRAHPDRRGRQFRGSLDELALYDRALGEAEVKAHFAARR
ncbi:MAG: LamG-like jellyroll fold domain-containing protein [Verrucomicrobiales bacterium]